MAAMITLLWMKSGNLVSPRPQGHPGKGERGKEKSRPIPGGSMGNPVLPRRRGYTRGYTRPFGPRAQ